MKGLVRSLARRSQSAALSENAVPTYAKAGLPNAASAAGAIVIVSDDVGGACLAISYGGAWKKLTLGATVS